MPEENPKSPQVVQTYPQGVNKPTSESFGVKQIKLGELDLRQAKIEHVYAVRSTEYAIYRAGDVGVQYADDPDMEKEQRKRVLLIGEARADLTSLLLGWSPERRKIYDCKLALALQHALDGDATAARKTVESTRSDVLNERAVAGRLQYLASAAVGCALLGSLLLGLDALWPQSEPRWNFWLAGQSGFAGAAFSIVLAIKTRKVALDTDLVGNASDGLLRLMIGMASGGLLLLFVACGLVPEFAVGAARFTPLELSLPGIAVLGFVAGFIERMVPDLLDKAQAQPVGAPVNVTS